MANVSLDLSSIKSAGVYVLEIDESQRTEAQVTALRLLVGFAGKGPFNRPVYLQNDAQRQKLFGDIDTKLEKKGCFFNRSARTMLTTGNILALNLLKVDDSFDGPDQVNYAALSLDAGKKNPVVSAAGMAFGEIDYLAESIDKQIYGTKSGDMIPFVGKTPFSSLYDRSRFWTPSENNLMQIAAAGLGVAGNTFEKANFLNFANCGTDEISVLVYKAENFSGYDITAKDWYGGEENIPYKWIRPSDYISDYFIRVSAFKGNWTNYPILSADSTWGKYFDNKGILKDKIYSFGQAEGITNIGSWTGCIIPDFVDKQGNYLYIKDRVNAQTESTGLLMTINEDAMEVIAYDLNGMDVETGQEIGTGCWIYDYDSNSEGESEAGESAIGSNGFLIDMVGHTFQDGISKKVENRQLNTSFINTIFDNNAGTLELNSSVFYLDDSSVDLGAESVTNLTTVKVPSFASSNMNGVLATNGNPLFLYGVYDTSTNRRLKNEYCYVAMDASSYNANSTNTERIKSLVAYNAKGNPSTGSRNTIGAATNAANLRLKKDMTDNTLYVDTSVLFGNYAAYANNSSAIYIFSVQSGAKGSEVVDSQIFDWDDLVDTSVQIGDNPENTSLGKTFSYNATKYYVVAPTAANQPAKFFVDEETGAAETFGVNFLSYNYVSDNREEVVCNVRNAFYFNGKTNVAEDDFTPVQLVDSSLFNGNNPVTDETLNMFIVCDEQEAGDITVGDFVNNITFNNNTGEATKYGLIPGITRIIQKIWVNLTANNQFTYKNKIYTYNNNVAPCIKTKTGKRGFYLYTAVDPVLIDNGHVVIRQLPISNTAISKSLRFIPLKGLHISARHRPGFDSNGRINIEAGIEKIYSVLEEKGIRRALMNTNTLDYRYIVDSMSFGINAELGGKRYLSALAMDRGMTTALLNAPSKTQFQNSRDPYFTDTFNEAQAPVPAFDLEHVVAGGNPDMYSTKVFSLPTEDDGSKFAACFYPHLLYRDNNHTIIVPPAADISNTFQRKFQGGNPYAITANLDGIIYNSGGYLVGVEDDLGTEDRDCLEPFGINPIIREQGRILIYGNQTCYQNTISDYNKLHVRENLNTMEREINVVLKSFVFKYNNDQTRAALVTQITPIMEALRTSGVLASYTLKCDAENNTADVLEHDAMVVDIEVWMNHGCEKIIQRIRVKKLSDLPAQG